jgi:hypothetical protein
VKEGGGGGGNKINPGHLGKFELRSCCELNTENGSVNSTTRFCAGA